MTLLLILFGLASIVIPVLARGLGRRVFLLAALVSGVAFVATLVLGLPAVLAGTEVNERIPWIPQLDLAIDLRLDALSLLLALVVTGVGALVFVYSAAYFRGDQSGLGRFAGILLAFAGSMYGLVLADNVYLLFVFWEATTVFSYLLIAHNRDRRASRNAALQALLVTTLGGLAMLVGLVLLAVQAGTASLSELLAEPPSGDLVVPAMVLVLVGVLSKSAIVPFQFWLPGAMAAPTPVSAYLHAAAMVKAGIYLAARLAPAFAETPGWRETLVVLGIATMLLGGVRALRQTDLKLLLAHGTVSQLGFLVLVAGWGTAGMAVAGAVLLFSHALFKSALFLVVGVVDHGCGTRDLRRITGFGRRAPLMATAATLSVVSMAGLPPALGFVGKEGVFAALLAESDASWIPIAVVAGIAAGSALTIAYGARFLWGAFASKRGVEDLPAEKPYPLAETILLFAPPILLAVAGVVAGTGVALLDPVLLPVAAGLPGETEHLALWHGLGPPLAISGGTVAVGLLLAAALARRIPAAEPDVDGAGVRAYRASLRAMDRVAALVTGLTQRGSLPFYLGVIFVVVTVAIGAALARVTEWPRAWDPVQGPAQLPIAILAIVAAIAATIAGKRFQAIVLVGVTGVGMAAVFALHGAPDLALTQILVELVTLVAVVLVLRRLPARLGARHGSRHRLGRAVVAIAVGVGMAAVAVVATAARVDAPISLAWPELAQEIGHGRNVVNVALVDLRGWDTMGELSVVIAAATGVASLIFLRSRTDNLPRVSRRRARESIRERRRALASPVDAPAARGSWLLAGRTLAPHHRSILLEVVVRLLFHSLIVLSVYLLLVGHNAPGGGFAGGLVAGLALVARYLAGGRLELGAAAPFDAGKILGAGLVLAAGTALVPLFFGVDALTSTWFDIDLGVIGHLEFVTSTIFDCGVYLVVIGLVLDVLRSLGAEVDRQIEDEAGASTETAVREGAR